MSKKKESEIVILFKIGDFNGLKEAESVEEIDQHEIYIPGKGRLRTRVSTTEDGTTMVHTLKPKGEFSGTVRTNDEENIDVPASYIEIFKKMAEKRCLKKRYVFSGKDSIFQADDSSIVLPPVKYEVDVFTRFDGQTSLWGKIDIEVQEFLAILDNHPDFKGKPVHATVKISHLPFKPQEAFFIDDEMTEEQLALSQRIWDEEFFQTPDGKPLKPLKASVKQEVKEKPDTEPVKSEDE